MPFGGGEVARFLGLTHDLGKGKPSWQEALRQVSGSDRPVGVPHKDEGTWWASQQVGVWASVVLGHHGGLPDREALRELLEKATTERLAEFRATLERVAAVVPEIRPAERPQLPGWLSPKDWQSCDVFMRLLFSAVVDADFLDTERHFSGARTTSQLGPADLVERFDEERAKLVAQRSSPLDGLRSEVYDYALAASALPPGMFRLPAPTGAGKTLAMAGFGLHHAARHGLRRVVMAVPFLSITEQNAGVLRGLLDGEDDETPSVLEHHSGIRLEAEDSENGGRFAWWQRLAAENWDAPFVVTTMVRLFESIFARRPSAMRKLHRLAGAVLVLDEVQALPDRLLLPILSVLRTLTEHFGTTVVLSSATQPSYWSLGPFQDLAVRDIVPAEAGLAQRARRVRYVWRLDPRPTWEEIAAEVSAEPQALVVVNTTKDAAVLHRRLKQAGAQECVHLSTRMTAEHRRRVLSDVKESLGRGEPVVVVSTQLVEAGVDLDFPVVWRAWTCADSVQQAAGRCNRDGRLERGLVVVFDPEKGGHPRDESYKAGLAATEAVFGDGQGDPEQPQLLHTYYRQRFTKQNLEQPIGSTEGGPVRPNGAMIQRWRKDRDFPRVAAGFRMIEESSLSVVVPDTNSDRREEAERLIAELQYATPSRQRMLLRQLQPFMAGIPKHEATKAITEGDATWLLGDLVLWRGPYDEQRGLESDNAYTEEDLVA
ncbi:CRISPR-associated helicase/endonuclease Cas3 [Salinactinospora qingdaonensis]|uniref:CRISPR-associated helicase/endonuclease Cas3 n=1 Tax=Salinactinospora qingdaonensis TaxID=702744 RepID=A0ABP7FVN1_9ACTN